MWERILWRPVVNSYITISSTEQRGIFSCAWVLPRVRAVPGLECPEVNKNKLWHGIKGRDIVLLGKQCLIAIMICESAAGRHSVRQPRTLSEAESRPVVWPADVANLQVNCKRADGEGELQQPALHSDEQWKAAERCCGWEVFAELCLCFATAPTGINVGQH